MNSSRHCKRANSSWPFYGLIALLIFVAACSVGPDYKRPAVTTPASYKEADTAVTAQSIDDVIKLKW